MYKRESKTGYTVMWSPEHEDLAKQAIEKHKGQGVPENVAFPDGANVPVDADTAASIRHTYRRLVLDRGIRAAHDKEDERLKEEYQKHTGKEWQE